MQGVGTAVRVEEIGKADIAAVGEFLHAHLNGRLSPADWAASITGPWSSSAPNHGFLLRADAGEDATVIVGVLLAFYSERQTGDATQRFCNVGAWCVLPEHRSRGLRLIRAVLAQSSHHFTDFSPSGNVIALNERLGFRHLDTTTALAVNLPVRARRGTRILSDEGRVVATLTATERQIHADHRRAAATHHVVIHRDDQSCYVLFRRDRRRGLPWFATVLYASRPDLLRSEFPALSRHLLVHHGLPFTLVELRVAGGRPRGTRVLAGRPKMVRSSLDDADIDYLYSELTCVPW